MVLEDFINNLLNLLTNRPLLKCSQIIRIHTRKLEENGDLSFPLSIKNWYNYLDTIEDLNEIITIFDYMQISNSNLDEQLKEIEIKTKDWLIRINKSAIEQNNVILHLNRESVFKLLTTQVLQQKEDYGKCELFKETINVRCCKPISLDCDLTTLRLNILAEVVQNLIHFCAITPKTPETVTISVTLNNNKDTEEKRIICGPIMNEDGVKDAKTTAIQLLKYTNILES